MGLVALGDFGFDFRVRCARAVTTEMRRRDARAGCCGNRHFRRETARTAAKRGGFPPCVEKERGREGHRAISELFLLLITYAFHEIQGHT